VNAALLKRIVRAIAERSERDLDELARKMVESERKTGHGRLATELETILSRSKQHSQFTLRAVETPPPNLRSLPQSRRFGEQLATVISREELEHDMVLPPQTEQRFARIEREFAARDRLSRHGLRPRKTILLYGPPGCGKSLGAKRLAWNIGLPLMKVRFDALISSYFGESAANLRSVFDAAKERSCVLLLDECDFIARSRSTGKDIGEASRIVNSLLQLMEEYDAPGILVATTNIESSLDDALFRRFDDVFPIPPPGREELERLLRLSLSAVAVEPSVSLEAMVDELEGASAAMVVKAARDAAKAAVLTGRQVVTNAHLRDAIAEVRSHTTER
jgi:SpoVK/Ycf46/Vps4 family AAA+-type ATPase